MSTTSGKQTMRSGVVLFDKPRGWTSREAVDHVQEQLGQPKAGHGGTLDPLAEGLLPIFVHEATKLVPYLQEQPKTYYFRLRLDKVSDTLDTEGEVREAKFPSSPDPADVQRQLEQFEGAIDQVPPQYSAVKIDGERAHEKARRGEDVEVSPRTVRCYGLTLEKASGPVVDLEVRCGKGFYVRSLARDLARALGYEGGVVTKLVRTQYGPYRRQEAVTPGELDSPGAGFKLPVTVLENFPTVECNEEDLRLVTHGSWIDRDQAHEGYAAGVDRDGSLHAVLESTDKRGFPEWRPRRVLHRDTRETSS